MKKFKDGVTMVEHGNKGRKSVMSKTAECIAWLQFFVNCIGDHQPDNGGIHLPSCFSKSDIYKKMLEENKTLNQPTISLSHFYSLWDKHFSHVIIPKVLQIVQSTFQSPLTSSVHILSARKSFQLVLVLISPIFSLSFELMKGVLFSVHALSYMLLPCSFKIPRENRFTKCTDCTRYKQEKEKTVDKAKRAQIDHLLKLQLELVWQERRVYYLHRYKARKFPCKYMANIADGMDQHTTNIPSVRRLSKAMSALTTVGTHLVGAIIHSGQAQNGKEIFGSFDYYQFPHDSNLTMTVLSDVLVYCADEYDLPPVLYLQFDNCVRENKNRFMFALLALLVEEKIFEKIRVNFLPVGHTHEDIDAFFGVYSKHLDKLDVYTVIELLKALESCMRQPTPKPFMLKIVYDIKLWIAEHAEELHEHTVPKCFKFELNEEGKAVMHYRNWSHEQWQGPIVMLKSVPNGKPNLVSPSLAKLDLEALKRDIPNKYPQNMPQAASEYWKAWLRDVESKIISVPDNYIWPVDKLKTASRTAPPPSAAQLPDDLLELREREIQPTPEIYTGRYRNPRERQAPIAMVDDFLATLEVGCFVALYFDNYDKEPVIGKVLSIEENHFQVHYWKGTYLGKWSPQHLPRRKTEPWLEKLPKTCIVCSSFQLTEDSKLMPSTRNFLKETYTALRNLKS
ncbi:uncharacterized protein [Montipora foliosa]|uniref:uncharacterized protein n=1 Tax=Montipora foliosa TaxID=591990 RepID=UPI0035F15262